MWTVLVWPINLIISNIMNICEKCEICSVILHLSRIMIIQSLFAAHSSYCPWTVVVILWTDLQLMIPACSLSRTSTMLVLESSCNVKKRRRRRITKRKQRRIRRIRSKMIRRLLLKRIRSPMKQRRRLMKGVRRPNKSAEINESTETNERIRR
jgi:hypothetical protein